MASGARFAVNEQWAELPDPRGSCRSASGSRAGHPSSRRGGEGRGAAPGPAAYHGRLHAINRRLGDQRKAMLHILEDYELDRRRLAGHGERLDNSRRALLHILKDSYRAKVQLENGGRR